jgi:hypothetical protein
VSRHSKLPKAKGGQDRESPQAAIGRLLKNMHQSLRQAMEDSLRRLQSLESQGPSLPAVHS